MALGRGADCGRPGAPARALPRTAADCGRTIVLRMWPERDERFVRKTDGGNAQTWGTLNKLTHVTRGIVRNNCIQKLKTQNPPLSKTVPTRRFAAHMGANRAQPLARLPLARTPLAAPAA